jgi:hypothetical protein
MPVYDFSSGFNALNQGIQSLGGSLQQADKQAKLSAVGKLIQSGNYDDASSLVAGMGDIDTAFRIKQFGILQKQANTPGVTLDTLSGGGGNAAPDASASAAAPQASAGSGGSASLTTTRSGSEISPTLKGMVWNTPAGPVDAQAASWAVHGVESKANDYSSVGPVVQKGAYAGDRAFGLHQVMGNNIGPWTQEVLGTPMTRQQFLASPEAQDKVFAAKFGEDAQKYGLAGAANKWFTGSPNPDPNRTDQYMRAGDYGNTVTTNYANLTKQMPAAAGGQVAPSRTAQAPVGAPIRVASAGAMPTPDTGGAPADGSAPLTGAPYNPGPQPSGQQASVPPAGAAPAAATAAPPAPTASPAIPFAKYGGKSFTRADAIKQDAIEANAGENDDVPDAPTTAEWDAQAKAAGVSVPAAGGAPAGAPAPGASSGAPAPASSAVSALPPQYQAAAQGYMGRVLKPLGQPGSGARIERLQRDIAAVAPSAKAGNPTSQATLEFLTAQRKQEMDLAGKIAEQAALPTEESEIKPLTPEQQAQFPGSLGMVYKGDKPVRPFYPPAATQKTPEQEYNARLPVAQKLGLQPGTPEFNSYMTGSAITRAPFSTTEEKIISETDDKNTKLTMALGALKKAQVILPQTFSGMTAGVATWLGRNDPTGVIGDAKTGAATTEYDNLVQSTALGVLKELFGGRVTNFEDQQFQSLQPNSGKSMQEKQAILNDLINRYESQQKAAQSKLERIQGKTYFGAAGPGGPNAPPNAPGGPNPSVPLQGAPGASAWKPPAVVPPDALAQARAAIAAKPEVRGVVIQRLRQMGVDPSGL